MTIAPVPKDEAERLRILYQYEILDSVAERSFDELTALASAICATPIATITLIDKERQWFKSAVGLPGRETARDVSFCAHAIGGSEFFQVTDAALDERFADNPFVTGDPGIRFYAGAPLVTPEQQAIGTICVIDRVPRQLTAEQERALKILSHQVVSMLELRRSLLNIEQLEAERELKDAQLRLLESAVRQTSDAVVITTSDLDAPGPEIVFVNPAFTKMTGYSAEEAIGRTPRFLQGPKTDRATMSRLRQELQDGGRFDGEAINYRKDGTEFPLEWSISPVYNGGSAPMNFVATQRDITERKRVRDELEQARMQLEERVGARTRDLEQANAELVQEIAERERATEALRKSQEQLFQAQKMEVLGQLAGGIAHDFNNILTAIMGYGTVLLEELPEAEREESHIAEILRAAKRAAGLSKQLLGFSRQDPYDPTVLRAEALVRGVEKMLRQVIGDRIVLKTELGSDAGTIKADAGQLEQVLLNLAINARDAMPSGGTITISAATVTLPAEKVKAPSAAREFVALTVRDDGTGIPPDVLPRIFEPFFTTKRPGQGTGLGLATCHSIAEKSGGWIVCESELGRGTAFTVYLPAEAEEVGSTATGPTRGALPRGTETVLVVEDEPMVGELVEMLLKSLGYQVARAEDGVEAEEVVSKLDGSIDLVLTDLNMPRMDGQELVRRLSTKNPDLKVILTSGNDVNDGDDRSTVAVDLLPKPFTMATLARKVRQTLDA